MPNRTVFLMYHELQVAGRAPIRDDPGYLRYVIDEKEFRAQLIQLRIDGFCGTSVGDWLSSRREEPQVVITFDDGCETDFLTAGPLLVEIVFKATFFVVSGFVGKTGFMTEKQIRHLHNLGFEIGCHSMTHAYLTDLDPTLLRVEVLEAKQKLEQILGNAVNHFSCPGGRFNRQVIRMAHEVGYQTVSTSRICANGKNADWFRLGRVALQRGTSIIAFQRICHAKGLLRRQLQDRLLSTAKGLLGNSVYEKTRSFVLGKARRS